jgi:hypothetical protein
MGVICVDCKSNLPASNFSKNQLKKDKDERRCKSCVAIKNAESISTSAAPVVNHKAIDGTLHVKEDSPPIVHQLDDDSYKVQENESKDENVTENKVTSESKEFVQKQEKKHEDTENSESNIIDYPSKVQDQVGEDKININDPSDEKETPSPDVIPVPKESEDSTPEILVPSNRIRVGICAMQKKAKSKPMVRCRRVHFYFLKKIPYSPLCNNTFLFLSFSFRC